VKLLLEVAVFLLINHKAVGLLLVRFSLHVIDACGQSQCILSYHSAFKSPRYCSDETKYDKYSSRRLLES
jgi:hypothetical protein